MQPSPPWGTCSRTKVSRRVALVLNSWFVRVTEGCVLEPFSKSSIVGFIFLLSGCFLDYFGNTSMLWEWSAIGLVSDSSARLTNGVILICLVPLTRHTYSKSNGLKVKTFNQTPSRRSNGRADGAPSSHSVLRHPERSTFIWPLQFLQVCMTCVVTIGQMNRRSFAKPHAAPETRQPPGKDITLYKH